MQLRELKHSSLQCGKDNEETRQREEEPTIDVLCGPAYPQHTFRRHHSQDIPTFHVQAPHPVSLLTSLLPSLLSIIRIKILTFLNQWENTQRQEQGLWAFLFKKKNTKKNKYCSPAGVAQWISVTR